MPNKSQVRFVVFFVLVISCIAGYFFQIASQHGWRYPLAVGRNGATQPVWFMFCMYAIIWGFGVGWLVCVFYNWLRQK